MARRRIRVEWPCWYFGPDGEKKLCDGINDVPSGWKNRPQPAYEAPEQRVFLEFDDLVKQLTDRGIKIDPRWGRAKLQEVLEND